MGQYENFLEKKTHYGEDCGIKYSHRNDKLFDFQHYLVEWALKKGRAAIFADCGLGKTPMQLVWAENIRRHTNKPVLIITPLAVGSQTIQEAEKFGVECNRSQDGSIKSGITITNYERLHKFNPNDFIGAVCDESSILKNFDGKRKAEITNFMLKLPYRLLCTATAAPNDYIELGTSSEALGVMGYTDMLGHFFKNDQNVIKPMIYRHRGTNFQELEGRAKWRFKRHGEKDFWRWVCSWARALRRPSDLGFKDDGFILPPLVEQETTLDLCRPLSGYLFPIPAQSLQEEREERRATLISRCEESARKVAHDRPAVVWCHLNDEGDLLDKLIKDSVQVSGKDSDDSKEEKLLAFSRGEIRVLITKPKIGAFGLNWQHCNHVTFFPSHSYEQYYQAVRRCWRFGQSRPVTVDIINTEGEKNVKDNLKRKSAAADKMFEELVANMRSELSVKKDNPFKGREEIPQWLSLTKN